MKALARACLVALPFLAAPTVAHAWCISVPGFQSCMKFNFHICPCPCSPCNGPSPMSPWYQYYPYDGYFQTPAPIDGGAPYAPVVGVPPGGWPYWPAAVPPPGTTYAASLAPMQLPNLQSVGYYGPASPWSYGQ
jgi:hypothetical protein